MWRRYIWNGNLSVPYGTLYIEFRMERQMIISQFLMELYTKYSIIKFHMERKLNKGQGLIKNLM